MWRVVVVVKGWRKQKKKKKVHTPYIPRSARTLPRVERGGAFVVWLLGLMHSHPSAQNFQRRSYTSILYYPLSAFMLLVLIAGADHTREKRIDHPKGGPSSCLAPQELTVPRGGAWLDFNLNNSWSEEGARSVPTACLGKLVDSRSRWYKVKGNGQFITAHTCNQLKDIDGAVGLVIEVVGSAVLHEPCTQLEEGLIHDRYDPSQCIALGVPRSCSSQNPSGTDEGSIASWYSQEEVWYYLHIYPSSPSRGLSMRIRLDIASRTVLPLQLVFFLFFFLALPTQTTTTELILWGVCFCCREVEGRKEAAASGVRECGMPWC